MDRFFGADIDPDDLDWHPWETQLVSNHLLTGVIERTGEDAAVGAVIVTWSDTVEHAKVAGHVVFSFLLRESGIELA